MVSGLEQRALDALDFDGLVELATRLVAIPSLGGQETPAQETMAEAMRDAGLEVDRWELDLEALSRHPLYCAEVERRDALGVVGSLDGVADGPTLIFNGHVDVVPAGDPAGWSVPPWEGRVVDGALWGRGSADMKGGLCCALFAARAIREAGVDLQGRLLIHSVVGEEDGGTGTLATLLRGHRGDGAVVMEPTALAVVPAQAGALNFRLTVQGRSAHGCVREEGVSAVEKFLPLFEALYELERARNEGIEDPLFAAYQLPFPLSIGRVRAGEWASSVPERLVCEGRYGIALGEEISAARSQFETAVARAAAADPWLAEHPPRVEWWGGQFESAATEPGSPVVDAVRSSLESLLGGPAVLEGAPYGSDMRLLVRHGGTPSVLFGPGDVRLAHGPDEHVRLEELEIAARTLTLTALRFLGAR